MTLTVGDFVAQRLDEWGVQRIYGYPGDAINGTPQACAGSAGSSSYRSGTRRASHSRRGTREVRASRKRER
jgi:hypothetical protein